MIKNYFRILKKPHAYLQTILKTPVKFQKDRTETVGGVKGTKYPLKTRNHAPRATRHAPRATHHAPRKTKNSVPPLFFEKAGDKLGDVLLSPKPQPQLCQIHISKLKYFLRHLVHKVNSDEQQTDKQSISNMPPPFSRYNQHYCKMYDRSVNKILGPHDIFNLYSNIFPLLKYRFHSSQPYEG